MDVNDLDTSRLKDLLMKLEFRSLLRNLPEHMQSRAATKVGLNDLSAIETTEEVGKPCQGNASHGKEQMSWPDGDSVWLSHERGGKATKLSLADAAEILAHVAVVGHDVKAFLKSLLTSGIDALPEIHHDTVQGSFLLNPLRKSKSLPTSSVWGD